MTLRNSGSIRLDATEAYLIFLTVAFLFAWLCGVGVANEGHSEDVGENSTAR